MVHLGKACTNKNSLMTMALNQTLTFFFTSLVPLQLFSIDDSTKTRKVIWKNPVPSSPRYCRPIKIDFLHETAEATRNEVDYIKAQIDTLHPRETVIDGKK